VILVHFDAGDLREVKGHRKLGTSAQDRLGADRAQDPVEVLRIMKGE
jgi:hypothetical protein